MMEADFLNVLGKDSGSTEVREFIEKYGLDDVQDDPPFRRYQGSPQRGLDLLIEHERVEDVQVHVQGRKRHQAFAGVLPFGLRAGITQSQVHQVLGTPLAADEFDSKFDLPWGRLTVVYDESSVVRYLSLAARDYNDA
jgi:hypothetical protein